LIWDERIPILNVGVFLFDGFGMDALASLTKDSFLVRI